jgi:hypothetical protein
MKLGVFMQKKYVKSHYKNRQLKAEDWLKSDEKTSF